jgi:disulfide bond formation protein DsbB
MDITFPLSHSNLMNSWMISLTAWTVSLVATVGSLFFSEVMLLPPCVLCWYQRIAMYPLTIILGMGLFTSLNQAWLFSLPLMALGWLVAVYHNLLYYKLIPESSGPCLKGFSCTAVQLEWAGFITIPLLSFGAFSLLLVLFFTQRVYAKK